VPDEPPPAEPDVCPECGADLTDRDPYAHALSHWPEKIPDYPETKLARTRQKQLLDLAKKRGVI